MLRCGSCYYFMIIKPIKNCEDYRFPFTPSNVLVSFNNFLEEEICRTVFDDYIDKK